MNLLCYSITNARFGAAFRKSLRYRPSISAVDRVGLGVNPNIDQSVTEPEPVRPMIEDYYTLLGVERDASEEAILQAYREKAAEHHPDVSDAEDAEATFQRLNRAKDVLSDAQRRREYDRLGHDRFVRRRGDDEAAKSPPARDQRSPEPSVGSMAGLSALGEVLGRLFGSRWSQDAGPRAGGWPGRRPPRGSAFDVDLTDRIRRDTPSDREGGSEPTGGDAPSTTAADGRSCPKCRGRGTFVHDIDTSRGRTRRIEPCERCGGSGTVHE